jgi:hypothetical protein
MPSHVIYIPITEQHAHSANTYYSASITPAPDPLVLADARPSAVLTTAPYPMAVADDRHPAFLTPASCLLQDACIPYRCSSPAAGGRCSPPRIPYSFSSPAAVADARPSAFLPASPAPLVLADTSLHRHAHVVLLVHLSSWQSSVGLFSLWLDSPFTPTYRRSFPRLYPTNSTIVVSMDFFHLGHTLQIRRYGICSSGSIRTDSCGFSSNLSVDRIWNATRHVRSLGVVARRGRALRPECIHGGTAERYAFATS